MKPIKGLVPASVWLLTATLLYFIYQVHFDAIVTFAFSGYHYFMVLALGLLGFLIAMGVLFKNDIMSVIGGVGLTLVALALIFIDGFTLAKLQQEFIFVVLGIYFAARGRS
ncbi:MAG: hypothetical protein ACWA6U_17535 [Breznakibacter sp.]